MILLIADLIGSKYAVSMESGNKLYEALAREVLEGRKKVTLDFQGISLTATPFYNASISYLLKDMSIDEILKHIEFQNMSNNDKHLANVSIHNAIAHYAKQKTSG